MGRLAGTTQVWTIAAVRRAGGRPRYTEYKGVAHDVWLHAFNEPELLDWVFSQRRR